MKNAATGKNGKEPDRLPTFPGTSYDEDIALVFEYLKQLLNPPVQPRRKIGFKRKDETD